MDYEKFTQLIPAAIISAPQGDATIVMCGIIYNTSMITDPGMKFKIIQGKYIDLTLPPGFFVHPPNPSKQSSKIQSPNTNTLNMRH